MPHDVEMATPHARQAADRGPVAAHNALRYLPADPAIDVIAAPISPGTITAANHGVAPVSGYSPSVSAAAQAITQPASTARIRRFTGRG